MLDLLLVSCPPVPLLSEQQPILKAGGHAAPSLMYQPLPFLVTAIAYPLWEVTVIVGTKQLFTAVVSL